MNDHTCVASLFRCLLVLLGLVSAGHGQLATATNPPAEVTAKTLFSIPFYVSPNAPPPAEVHLYVSGDSGRSWTLYQRRQPTQSKFDFQAGKDGEYWFAVRTNEDREPPNRATRPEKIVIVDRADPDLSIDLRLGSADELVASYRAEDANLDPNSLRLEYRVSDNAPWEPVSVNRTPTGTPLDRQLVQQQISWVVPATVVRVEVRAAVADRAGNRREMFKTLDLRVEPSPSATADAVDSLPSWRQQTGVTELEKPVAADPLPWLEQPPASPTSRGSSTADRERWRSTGDDWRSANVGPTESPLPSTVTETPERTFSAENEVAQPAPTPHEQSPPQPVERDLGMGSSPALAVDTRRTWLPERNPIAEPTPDAQLTVPQGPASQRAVPPAETYAPPVASRFDPVTPPRRPDVQMTSSRRFNLDYDVAGSGPDGVARVELWITDDNGNTWQPYGLDRDLLSPFLVELDREGIFGFRMLIHNLDGSSARPPQPGDDADLWIGLDWTAPRARWLKADVVTAPSTQTVLLQWEAEDEHLTDRPIRLSYAPGPDGPWSIIADELANTGSFAWGPAQPLPARTYLLLEVRDRAGNVTSERLPDPIGSGAGGPKGIIRGIRPLDEGASAAGDPES